MSEIFGAYLEDYQYIKIIIPKDIKVTLSKLFLKDSDDEYRLTSFKDEYFGNEHHLHVTFIGLLNFHKDYYISINDELTYNLKLGKITKTQRFNKTTYFDDWLGYQYNQEYTTFRIWTPVAKEVMLVINNEKIPLEPRDKGVWEKIIYRDCERMPYYYEVRINQDFIKILDPYAIASSSNNEFNYVINFENTYLMKNNYIKLNKYTEAIIYETHIRDFTINLPVKNPGTYLGMLESANLDRMGLNAIQELGITHLQLMPLFCFGGVNEKIKDSQDVNFKYNWGYNPVQFNIPSGWYSTDPNDPYCRINELKQLIDYLHEQQIGVNIDVVFNHVYNSETFSLGKLVPGYVYRTDNHGFMTNSSGCGNDIATNRLMVRKYIIDSILFWQSFYKVDGFRFDLMGLMDVDTIEQAKKLANQNNPSTMFYGEGWIMPTDLSFYNEANQRNFWALPEVGFFNDAYRNTFRGSTYHPADSFIVGKNYSPKYLHSLLCGSCIDGIIYNRASHSINYLECHDNYTIIDQIKLVKPDLSKTELEDYAILALGIVLMSIGIPFIHSGQEYLRTKKGIENSYNSGDLINAIVWEGDSPVRNALIDLIKLRKQHKVLSSDHPHIIKEVSSVNVSNNLVELRYNENNHILQIIFSNNYEENKMFFAPGTKMIFDGHNLISDEKSVDSIIISKPGVYIFKK